jgi:dTDP-4-dehydrorhamnose reductase
LSFDARCPVAIWGGFECTVARLGDRYRDQIVETGHLHRESDLDLVAELGIRTLRYPVLWERVAPQGLEQPRWDWHDRRLLTLRDMDVAPIVGLVHHGSGPRYTNLLDPAFSDLLERYAGMVADRYPWVTMFTPVNEPLTTARFSSLYGHWYPHRRDVGSFLRAVFNQIQGTVLAMKAIRRVTPGAQLVQTEDLGKTFASPQLRYQSDYENTRRWLSLDLLCGRITPDHAWFQAFLDAGIERRALQEMVDEPTPPDIVGVNYYLSSDRYLDQRLCNYPEASHGGNGCEAYADVEATRIEDPGITCGLAARLAEIWDRYGLPLAVTEAHNGCTREEQLRWLTECYSSVEEARRAGIDVRALTVWALAGLVDWNSLLTRHDGHYESGAVEVQGSATRRTALAAAVQSLAKTGQYDHPVLDAPGWWHRGMRYYGSPKPICAPIALPARRLLITGASGTLGRAFSRLCHLRGLPHELTSRAELDIADPDSVARALERYRPWAVINAAGYVRVADAENEPERCHRENIAGAETLARASAKIGIQLLTFSSDLVFDGRLGRPYMETDATSPIGTYGSSKAVAERRVLETLPQAIVVRTSAFFGPWDRYSFIYNVLASLKAGRPFVVVNDCRVTPTYVPDLVHRALDLMIDGESGIWHLANEGALHWSELARCVAESAGFDAKLVIVQDEIMTSTELASQRGPLLPPLKTAINRFIRDREAA